jgi:S-adenosylmethionine:diacylglycerol 3-amino-3-carboxypropyl transferase
MYASIWRFTGDPDDLTRRYDTMLADIPSANMRLHLCVRAPDGIVIVDTCPSHAAFEQFATGPFRALRSRHGLPEPTDVQDGPVHAAFIEGEVRDQS